MSITGKRIKERRQALGMSADDLADVLGVNRSTVFRYERGDIEKLPASIIPVIARALHCSAGYLMGWSDSPLDQESSAMPTKYSQLDSIDKAKVDGFIDALLLDEKYQKKTAAV